MSNWREPAPQCSQIYPPLVGIPTPKDPHVSHQDLTSRTITTTTTNPSPCNSNQNMNTVLINTLPSSFELRNIPYLNIIKQEHSESLNVLQVNQECTQIRGENRISQQSNEIPLNLTSSLPSIDATLWEPNSIPLFDKLIENESKHWFTATRSEDVSIDEVQRVVSEFLANRTMKVETFVNSECTNYEPVIVAKATSSLLCQTVTYCGKVNNAISKLQAVTELHTSGSINLQCISNEKLDNTNICRVANDPVTIGLGMQKTRNAGDTGFCMGNVVANNTNVMESMNLQIDNYLFCNNTVNNIPGNEPKLSESRISQNGNNTLDSSNRHQANVKKPIYFEPKNNLKAVKGLTPLVTMHLQNIDYGLSVSEKLGVSKEVDNSEVDTHWIGNGSEFKCDICMKVYYRKDKMREHVRAHLGIKPFACTIDNCNASFVNIYTLHKHAKDHNSAGFQCLKCTKKYAQLKHLKDHENTHTGNKPYKCDECGMCFHMNTKRWYHIKHKHQSKKYEVLCEICGKVARTAGQNLRHMEEVHMRKKHYCKECDKNFYEMKLFKDHVRFHRGEDQYTCGVCSKSFIYKDYLRRHVKIHFHRASLKCPKCDKVFQSKLFFKGHLLQHKGIKKHCCKVCGKTFTHVHYLHSHMKSHGEKKFICSLCGGKFNRKDNLKSHIKRHLLGKKKKGTKN